MDENHTGVSEPKVGGNVAPESIRETALPLPDRRMGKVRDVYATDESPPRVVLVATDRLSAFDVVMPTPVPGKGRILTAIATRWFEELRPLGIIGDHLVSTDPADIPGLSDADRQMLDGRVMLGRAAQVIPIECVVRAYLAGSGWVDYQESGAICGVALPAGLKRSDRLPEPIFTPATKADVGHDENIGFDAAAAAVGQATMERLRDVSFAIFAAASERAARGGLILADTKFEFGFALGDDGKPTDEIILIDEVLTPDSSRYWPADQWTPGEEPASFDKQFVRNHLLELVAAGMWDKTAPGPELPADIVERTMDRYREAAARLFPDAG